MLDFAELRVDELFLLSDLLFDLTVVLLYLVHVAFNFADLYLEVLLHKFSLLLLLLNLHLNLIHYHLVVLFLDLLQVLGLLRIGILRLCSLLSHLFQLASLFLNFLLLLVYCLYLALHLLHYLLHLRL